MSTSAAESYIFPSSADAQEPTASNTYENDSDNDDITSLPSSTDSSELLSRCGCYSNAQEEWEQSLQQLELVLTMVLVPYIGKYFGRKFAYWSECSRVTMLNDHTDTSLRLGKVHDMETYRYRGPLYQQGGIQCGWSGGSGCNIISVEMNIVV